MQHSIQQKVGPAAGGSGLDYPLPGQVWCHFGVFPARTNAKSGPLLAKVAPALRQSRAGLTRHLGRFTPNPGRQQILGEPAINTAKVGPVAGGRGPTTPCHRQTGAQPRCTSPKNIGANCAGPGLA